MKKSKALLIFSLTGMLTCFGPALTSHADWKTTSEGTIYTLTEAPGYLTGLKKIGNYWYYFNEKGIMQTGMQTIDKKLYYFSAKGIMQKGWITTQENKIYYAQSNGVLVTDQWVNNYYFQEDGTLAKNQWINGKWVGSDGKYTGIQKKIGWITENGSTYYYNTNGTMVKGFLTLNGNTYYLQSSTGKLLKGWITVSGKKYYAGLAKGIIQKNTWVEGKYLTSNGTIATGLMRIRGKYYLFNSEGVKTVGWAKYNDKIYYFNNNGVLQISKWIGNCYVRKNGNRASGLLTLKKKTYYFDPQTGEKHTGWLVLDKNKYWFNKNGELQKSRWLWSKKYYASENGAIMTGLNKIGKNIYYFDTTTGIKLTNSRKVIRGATYYFQANGTAAKKKWVKISGKYYYFMYTGRMAKNTWVGNYYVDPTGARTSQTKQSGWVTINSSKYYFDSNMKMLTGWQTIGDEKYYFAKNGIMLTGIQTIEEKKYFFFSDGKLATGISIMVGSKEYTIDENGVITKEESLKISNMTTGGKIVNFAIQYVGNPYVYGGTSLTKGADCSGFVQTVFATFGIKLLRVADDQMKGPNASYISQGYKKGTRVDLNNLLPGDLLFYGTTPSYASHVAIYIGNGQIVHASNSQPYPAGGIKISAYNYQTPIAAMRYWN